MLSLLKLTNSQLLFGSSSSFWSGLQSLRSQEMFRKETGKIGPDQGIESGTKISWNRLDVSSSLFLSFSSSSSLALQKTRFESFI